MIDPDVSTTGRSAGLRMPSAYAEAVRNLQAQLAALPADQPVRLAKRTSNLFRTRTPLRGPGLDASAFARVFAVDPSARTADVGGLTTYEDLVAATLPHDLVPLVVPQLKTITLGGAVTGLGIEAASFRNGLPHESVVELDVLTPTGDVITAQRDGNAADLFHAFPNSYGTLGYALRLRIELESVTPYVHLRHVRFPAARELVDAIDSIVMTGEWSGQRVDYLDGTAFSPGEMYLTLGRYSEDAPDTSDYTSQSIYYRSIQQRREDWLTIHDYLWRWDTDWFWCSRAFGVQRPMIRRMIPKRFLRSDTYWRLVALENRYGVKRRLDRALGGPPNEAVIQDIEVPLQRLPEFLSAFDREVGMRPVWLCPLRSRDGTTQWPLYALDPKTTYVNVGFWGAVPLRGGRADGHHNRLVERLVTELGGRKSLYSTAFYGRDEFGQTYGGEAYREVKARYDPASRFLDLYEKCVERR